MSFFDVLLTACVPVIWGTTYIVTSQLLPPGLPMTAAVIRVLPAGLVLILWTRHLPARGECLRLLLLSFLNIGAFQALLFVAAYRLPGGIAALLGACQPLVLMGLVWVVERRAPRPLILAAALLGVGGIALLLDVAHRQWDMIGLAAAACGAVVMACGIYLTRRWGSSLPVLSLTGWQLLLGGGMLLPLAIFTEPGLPVLTGWNFAGYAYLCVFGALIAYALWFRGVRRLPSVSVAALGLLSPVTAVILGWWLLGQQLQGLQLLGLAPVLASVYAVQWGSITQRG
ncbi:EamA family transporter [Uliginosibacterium gangwonense]|uniref:EamA family transporter n=1 Tax=Uliginosibacterium gangwonense TaxID=392736 RepID=UPI000381B494|nr:EamA family transporter [Uliginosibacterium gangwonense]